jgi:hypothetical protein
LQQHPDIITASNDPINSANHDPINSDMILQRPPPI